MKAMKSYVKETLARLSGDNNEVVAQKNYRKATSILNGQIAALKAKQVDAESVVEDADENLKNVKFPSSLITNSSSYITNLNAAKERFADAKQALEDVKTSIKEAETTLAEFEAEVG